MIVQGQETVKKYKKVLVWVWFQSIKEELSRPFIGLHEYNPLSVGEAINHYKNELDEVWFIEQGNPFDLNKIVGLEIKQHTYA